jgi:hypothetical protein
MRVIFGDSCIKLMAVKLDKEALLTKLVAQNKKVVYQPADDLFSYF